MANLHNSLGERYYTEKKYDEAAGEFETALGYEQNPRAAYGKGLSLWAMGDFKEAAEEFEKVTKAKEFADME